VAEQAEPPSGSGTQAVVAAAAVMLTLLNLAVLRIKELPHQPPVLSLL
jgi:hypothetical protein